MLIPTCQWKISHVIDSSHHSQDNLKFQENIREKKILKHRWIFNDGTLAINQAEQFLGRKPSHLILAPLFVHCLLFFSLFNWWSCLISFILVSYLNLSHVLVSVYQSEKHEGKSKTKQSFFACFLATAKTFVSSEELAIKTFFFPTKSGMHRNGIFSWKRRYLRLCKFLAEQVLWPRQNWHPRFSLLVKINYQPHGHSSLKYWSYRWRAVKHFPDAWRSVSNSSQSGLHPPEPPNPVSQANQFSVDTFFSIPFLGRSTSLRSKLGEMV